MIQSQPMTAQPNNRGYGFHCLAYLDILGQRRKLRQFSSQPKDDAETQQLLKETAGAVIRLRELSHTCLDTLGQDTPDIPLLPPDLHEIVRQGRQSIKTLGFSDSFIMWIPFGGDLLPSAFDNRRFRLYGGLLLTSIDGPLRRESHSRRNRGGPRSGIERQRSLWTCVGEGSFH